MLEPPKSSEPIHTVCEGCGYADYAQILCICRRIVKTQQKRIHCDMGRFRMIRCMMQDRMRKRRGIAVMRYFVHCRIIHRINPYLYPPRTPISR